ncbi:unnamed protein product [Protopolystoma xenopodis]|uniref:Uncharacterized protein n=1 Tax=Protopolystoma xenopodis TaxID=117903 RepID=A0A3S5BC21_9PLAT|nr:unnamed protein product [Protopolystoma xenopodis]
MPECPERTRPTGGLTNMSSEAVCQFGLLRDLETSKFGLNPAGWEAEETQEREEEQEQEEEEKEVVVVVGRRDESDTPAKSETVVKTSEPSGLVWLSDRPRELLTSTLTSALTLTLASTSDSRELDELGVSRGDRATFWPVYAATGHACMRPTDATVEPIGREEDGGAAVTPDGVFRDDVDAHFVDSQRVRMGFCPTW